MYIHIYIYYKIADSVSIYKGWSSIGIPKKRLVYDRIFNYKPSYHPQLGSPSHHF
jgi:hypothetical protein